MGIEVNYQPDMMQVGQLAYNSAAQQAANKMQLYRDQNSQRIQERNLQRIYELQDRDAQQQAEWLQDSIKVAEKTANDLRAVYNPSNLTETGRTTWAELQGKLKAVQKQRSLLTPAAYAELMGKWIGDVEMSGMDNHVIKVPSVNDDFFSNAIDADTMQPVDPRKPPKKVFIRRKDSRGNITFDLHDLTGNTSSGLKVDPVKDEQTAIKNIQTKEENELSIQMRKDEAEYNAKKEANEKWEKEGAWFSSPPYPDLPASFNKDDPKYKPSYPSQEEIDAETQRIRGLRGSAATKPAAAPAQPAAAPAQPAAAQPAPAQQPGTPQAVPMDQGTASRFGPALEAAQAPAAPPVPLPFPTKAEKTGQIEQAQGEVKVGSKTYPVVGVVHDSNGEELQVIAYPISGIPVHAVANQDGTFSLLEEGEDGRWKRTKKIIDPDVTPTERKQPSISDIANALPKGDKDADLVRELLNLIVTEGSAEESTWSPEGKKALEKLGGSKGPYYLAAMGIGSYLQSGVPPMRFVDGMKEKDLAPGGVYSVMLDGKAHTAVWVGDQFIPLSTE